MTRLLRSISASSTRCRRFTDLARGGCGGQAAPLRVHGLRVRRRSAVFPSSPGIVRARICCRAAAKRSHGRGQRGTARDTGPIGSILAARYDCADEGDRAAEIRHRCGGKRTEGRRNPAVAPAAPELSRCFGGIFLRQQRHTGHPRHRQGGNDGERSLRRPARAPQRGNMDRRHWGSGQQPRVQRAGPA
jgi:hypothetical protein